MNTTTLQGMGSTKKVLPSKYAGWTAFAGKGAVNIRTAPGIHSHIIKTARDGEAFGTVVGLWHSKVDGYSWYVIVPSFTTRYKYVYAASGYFQVRKSQKTIKQTQLTVKLKQLIRNNKATTAKLLHIIKLATALHKARKISDTQAKHILDFVMQTSNQMVSDINQILSWARKGYLQLPSGNVSGTLSGKLWNALKDTYAYWNNLDIGWKILLGPAAGGLILGRMLLSINGMVERSKTRLQISNKLEEALQSLSQADRQAVINDLQHQLDQAYNTGYSDASFEFGGSILKYGLVAAGAIWLANKISQ